jgi:hypothetical protein
MSQPFLRFEDGKIALGGKDLLVQSAQLSIAPSLEADRVYGDYDAGLAGAKIELPTRAFSPVGGLVGSLSITFIVTADFFAQNQTVNSIDRLFDISSGMSEAPINGNIVGRYVFDHMYLKDFGFSLSPFRTIVAKASYNIYGTIRKRVSERFTRVSLDPAHGLKSFGEVKASGSSMDSYSGGRFEVTQLEYNILVGRKISNLIRESEHTTVNTRADGVLPSRVSVENIEVTMTVKGNEIVRNLNPMGDAQSGTTPDGLSDSSIDAYLYSLSGNRIAKFSCTGKIMQQSLSVAEGAHSMGSLTIKQIIK